MEEDVERNPEQHSFSYLILTVRALGILRRIPNAVAVRGTRREMRGDEWAEKVMQ